MRIIYLITCLMLVLAKAPAQTSPPAADLPSPEDFFPDYGKSFLHHHQLVDYFELVAEASPRVHIEQYGTTYEGRPLLLAYISSASNIAQLEQLRTQHLQRSGMLPGSPSTTEALAVVWLSYSVHGNETAGSEASPRVLHGFASAKPSDSLAQYLENTVVIMDPSLNPDGYTRYTDDQRRRASRWPDASPYAWEHLEPWPQGRTNHYLFDLNRDWVWASQVETQARLAAYQRWMPHVHADLHEMSPNSTYYFAPAAEPFHAYITDFQRSFQTEIGANHARIFDDNGWLYYTRESFDLLYPSYGDTYPTFNGAIGMTYEQAGGSGSAGRSYQRREGDTLTLADRIAHHTTTSWSTVAVASKNADRLVAATSAYRQNASAQRRGDYEAYVFPRATNSFGGLNRLTELLDQHGIAYGGASSAQRLSGVEYGSKDATSFDVQANDLVVPARQVQGVLAQVLLDPTTQIADSLTYDITAWSIPLVFGLNGMAVKDPIGDLNPYGLFSEEVDLTVPDFGYSVTMDGLHAWTKVAPLLDKGLKPRVATRTSTIQGERYEAGSLLVLQRDQRDEATYRSMYDSLYTVGASLTPLPSGFASDGPDLGAGDVSLLRAPRVALLQDDEASSGSFGHLWHFFERRLDYPVHLLPLARLSPASLSGVDVLIIADGRYSFGGQRGEQLEAFVRNGGRLIALEGAAEALSELDAFGLTMNEQSAGLKTAGSSPDPMAAYANRERANIASETPGALVAAQVDHTHPIGFGVKTDELFMLRTADRPWAFFDVEDGVNVVGVRKDPTVYGFIGSEVRGKLPETLSIGVEQLGRGEVVYVADNLAYRGFWDQGMHLLANAVFYR